MTEFKEWKSILPNKRGRKTCRIYFAMLWCVRTITPIITIIYHWSRWEKRNYVWLKNLKKKSLKIFIFIFFPIGLFFSTEIQELMKWKSCFENLILNFLMILGDKEYDLHKLRKENLIIFDPKLFKTMDWEILFYVIKHF